MAWRYMRSRRSNFFNLVSILSIVGLALGVATLTIVTSVVNGFEVTLRKSVIDVSGHIWLLKLGGPLDPLDKLLPRVKKILPELQTAAPYVHVDGMVPHKGKIAGVAIEGFDPQNLEKTLPLKERLTSGSFDLGTGQEAVPPVIVARGLSEKLNIKVGEQITIALPKNSPTTRIVGFIPRAKKFKVVGIVDLGMYQYDSRFILTSVKAARDLGGLGNVYTGLRLKLSDYELAQKGSFALATELGPTYISRDWYELNQNLFSAIELERIVIFIVFLFMTVAACFNVSSTLFISVLRRFGDLSILKTLGASRKKLQRLFSIQGIFLGVLGAVIGLVLGISMCFIIAHTNLLFVPAEIYHVRRLPIDIRFFDLFLIVSISLALCFLSTVAPARRAARLDPIEGLRYD